MFRVSIRQWYYYYFFIYISKYILYGHRPYEGHFNNDQIRGSLSLHQLLNRVFLPKSVFKKNETIKINNDTVMIKQLIFVKSLYIHNWIQIVSSGLHMTRIFCCCIKCEVVKWITLNQISWTSVNGVLAKTSFRYMMAVRLRQVPRLTF